MKTFSDRFKLSVQDWLKGLIVAIGGALFTIIETCVRTWTWTFDWQDVLRIAVSAGVAYIGKQFLTGQPTAIEIDSTKTEVKDISK
jgi:hypothetical protein